MATFTPVYTLTNLITMLAWCCQLVEEWDKSRQELADFSMSSVTTYMQHNRYLATYTGARYTCTQHKYLSAHRCVAVLIYMYLFSMEIILFNYIAIIFMRYNVYLC